MDPVADSSPNLPHSGVPRLDEVLHAAAFVSPVRWRPAVTALDRGALLLPAAGLAVGGLAALIDAGLRGVAAPGWLRAAVSALVLLGAGRGFLLLSWGRSGAALGADRRRALQRMRQPRLGVGAWIFLVAGVAGTVAAVAALGGARPTALLFAPMLGCWSAVVCAFGARDAAQAGSGVKFARGITFREFALASVFTFGVLFSATEAVGIAVGVAMALATIGLRLLWHRWLGGVSGAAVGATGFAVQLLALLLFAAL